MRHTIRTATLLTLVCLACLGVPSLAHAGPITPGDGWHQFNWTNAPNTFQNESAFTFSANAPTDLMVTDAFVAGDRFEVYDFGTLVGTTSQVNGFGTWTSDPNVAYPSGGFSTGLFALSAGNHSLTFKNIQAPSGQPSGTAFFRVDPQGTVANVVPEPGTITLVAIGVAGLAFGRGRRLFSKKEPA